MDILTPPTAYAVGFKVVEDPISVNDASEMTAILAFELNLQN